MNISINEVKNIPHQDYFERNVQRYGVIAEINSESHELDVYLKLDDDGRSTVEYDELPGLCGDAQDDLFMAVIEALPA